ncbi:MAG: KamA family radical SAM protein, partial [Parachlamydiales bacterium]
RLATFLKIEARNRKKILCTPAFPLSLPYRLARKIKKNDLQDPLFLQFVPLKKELELHFSSGKKTGPSEFLEKKNLQVKKKPDSLSFSPDPVCDQAFLQGRLLKKYCNRAVLLCANFCPMHCRFCFRQNLSFTPPVNFEKEIGLIRQNRRLNEIILSGGDPLALGNQELKELLTALEKIEHVKRLRIHSRFLIGVPERLDEELLEIFSRLQKPLYFVLHINHPSELDDEVKQALKKLRQRGLLLMNQSVLLKGVNDNLKTLLALSEELSNNGILFYYLHQLDRIQGAKHFEVSPSKGQKLIQGLLAKTSGYAVPKYVQEIPFQKSKTPLS